MLKRLWKLNDQEASLRSFPGTLVFLKPPPAFLRGPSASSNDLRPATFGHSESLGTQMGTQGFNQTPSSTLYGSDLQLLSLREGVLGLPSSLLRFAVST